MQAVLLTSNDLSTMKLIASPVALLLPRWPSPAAFVTVLPQRRPASRQAKPDLAKGEAKFAAVCAACHAADGNSTVPANPKLAQQHPEYLLKQLQEFKSGKRANAVMQGIGRAAER